VVGGLFTEVGGQAIDRIDGPDDHGELELMVVSSSAEVVSPVPDDNVFGAIAA
jgi:hypothetical protein